ncbi:MAG: hypothetical protein AB1832_03475 [Pseudomonadota bacterium]
MTSAKRSLLSGWLLMAVAFVVTAAVYWQGLYGAWLFDDYPNIVDNHDLQITDTHLSSLARAALSSPSSELKRPLASLSFAANYLIGGLDPFGWKLTNLVIHLLNGLLIFLVARGLLRASARTSSPSSQQWQEDGRLTSRRAGLVAALIAAGWMLLPINLTGVLYVVQRMESLANLFVLAGLLGYLTGRQRILEGRRGGLALCIVSVLAPTVVGVMVKETAVMLPLYAFLIEWLIFRFRGRDTTRQQGGVHRGLVALFVGILALPMTVGLAWLLPGLLKAGTWATRDFGLGTRLLSEARIVTDYIGWTIIPTPRALSFYHDDFQISTGLFTPWTTVTSVIFLALLASTIWLARRRRPLAALGVSLYLGCHLLTGTIIPLELIYEHRNYFASFGLLLALIPLLTAPGRPDEDVTGTGEHRPAFDRPLPLALSRHVLLLGLLALWGIDTASTAHAWGNPLRLAEDLAARAPDSPRAQYELGRTYIVLSHYDPNSVFTRLAYAPLERAMNLPRSSILPEQALIFMNARMGLPIKDAWWDSMIAKLRTHAPNVQDESSLASLTQCARDGRCQLSHGRMIDAYLAALAHPKPSSRLLASYGDYAWNVLGDHELALRMARAASAATPNEPAYHITLAQELLVLGHLDEAQREIDALQRLNVAGSLDANISRLSDRLRAAR